MGRNAESISVTIVRDPYGFFRSGAKISKMSLYYMVLDKNISNGMLMIDEPDRGKYAGSCQKLLYYNNKLYNITCCEKLNPDCWKEVKL